MEPAAPPRVCLTLTWQTRDGAEQTYELPAGDPVLVTIGRSVACDVNVEHPTISRRHAELAVRDGQCRVRDLESTYGTRVNGTRISAEAALGPGDTFMLGRARFVVGSTAGSLPPPDALVDDGPPPDPATTIVRPVAPVTAQTSAEVASPQAARLLRLLTEITRSLVQRRDLAEVLDSVVDLVFEAVAAERTFLLLRDSPFDPLT